MDKANVSVFSETACRLGEGPTYDPASDTLYWFDIVERKLLEKNLSGPEVRHSLPEMASALAVIDANRHLVFTETGLHVRDLRSGKLTLHTAIEADNPETRSNDARVHPSGAFWLGTMSKKAKAGAGAIYWFFKGELRRTLLQCHGAKFDLLLSGRGYGLLHGHADGPAVQGGL